MVCLPSVTGFLVTSCIYKAGLSQTTSVRIQIPHRQLV